MAKNQKTSKTTNETTDNLIVTIELALLILLPLILYFQRIYKGIKIYIYAIVLYLIWFGTYSLLHELCHMFASWMMGAKIYDYQLIPRFWEGDYKNGFVKSGLETAPQRFVSPIAPYLRDMVFLAVGYIILKKEKITHPFITGLGIVLFILSPLYDVFNNYFAFVLGAKNDFNCIKGVVGTLPTHSIGLVFTMIGLFVAIKTFIQLKKR